MLEDAKSNTHNVVSIEMVEGKKRPLANPHIYSVTCAHCHIENSLPELKPVLNYKTHLHSSQGW